MTPPARQTVIEELTFPEGPRWHDDALWFSDMHSGTVYRWDGSGEAQVVTSIDGRVSGLGWLPDGALLFVSMLDRKLLRHMGGRTDTYAELGSFVDGDANDLITLPDGTTFVGAFGFDLHGKAEPCASILVRVSIDGATSVAARELWFPNGMAVEPGGGRLIVAESYGHRLTSFALSPDGDLADRRVWADIPGIGPDGIAMDSEGAVWAAGALDRAVVRVTEGGTIDHRIPYPSGIPVACCLGGPEGRTLFVCVSDHLDPVKCRERRSARIDAIEVDVSAA